MNTILTDHPTSVFSNKSLNVLVQKLCFSLMAKANCTRTTVTTDIAPEVQLLIDGKQLEPVISLLLSTVVNCANNGRIHVSVERYRNLIILNLEEKNNYNGYALAYNIKALEPLARAIGAELAMKDQQKLHTTISLTFLNDVVDSNII